MPIYEYRCQDCQDEFEVMQKISDGALRKCKKCGGRLEKLLSKTSFVLKGGGWYSDGYSGGSKGGGSSKPDSSGAKSKGSSSEKSSSSSSKSSGGSKGSSKSSA